MSSPNIWLLFGSFESITFEVKRLRLLFGQHLVTLIPSLNGSTTYFENICRDVVENGDNEKTDLFVELWIVQHFFQDGVDLVQRQRQRRLFLAPVQGSLSFGKSPLINGRWERSGDPFLKSRMIEILVLWPLGKRLLASRISSVRIFNYQVQAKSTLTRCHKLAQLCWNKAMDVGCCYLLVMWPVFSFISATLKFVYDIGRLLK